MPPSPTKYCLHELTDYSDFESLCHDLMVLEGYPKIEPLGGFSDKGRDAIHIDNSGRSTIFAYSVREDWRAKLAEDAAKLEKHNHKCDEMVFLCTADFSATARDEAVARISADYGWELKLYGLERLRVLLDSKHSHIKSNHPAIFPPAFLKEIESEFPTKSEKHHLLIINAQADHVFAEWLARKLTAEGYAVWTETLKSLGEDRYPEDVNEALKMQTFRVVAVYSKSFFESPDAVGLRALALNLGKEAKIDFVIPLSIDPTEQFRTISKDTISPLEFGRNWAKGLSDLTAYLLELDCPRPRFDGKSVSSSFYDDTEVLSESAETLYSNAFLIESIPPILHRFEVSDSSIDEEIENRWAFRKVGEKLVLSLSSPPDDILQTASISQIGGDSWPDISEITWSERGEGKKIYISTLIPELIRKSVKVHCYEKGLKYCGETELMYFPGGLLARDRLPAYLPDGTKMAPLAVHGERKYYRPDDKSTYYRYYLAPTFFVDSRLFVEPGTPASRDFKNTVLYVRLRLRFTDTENNVLSPRTALSRRKHLCIDWWNDDWFRRTLGVAQFLADDDGKIRIGKEAGKQIVIRSLPKTFEISAGINEDALKILGADRSVDLRAQFGYDESDAPDDPLEDE